MVMPQRDDPPSRCALRRTGTIEAIKRRAAAEKKAANPSQKSYLLELVDNPVGVKAIVPA